MTDCRTRYPLLLIHGLNCRDDWIFPYWGRVADILREHGAAVYLSGQDAWGSVPGNARALLRRAGMAQQSSGGGQLTVAHILLDADQRSAWKAGQSMELTAKEFDLMELLMRNPGRVYSRENLLNVVWGYEYMGDYRTVDVHIRRLREKLEENPAEPDHIMTKWGVGYYFKE